MDDARERILRAGTLLIARAGIGGVNSNQIAREAGLGVGSFYAHFKDKHALHGALAEQAVDRVQAEAQRALAAAGPTPEAQARALVETWVDFAERSPEQFRVAFGPEAPRAGARALSTRGSERALEGLRAAGALLPEIDPRVAAHAFAVMQNGVLCWWLDARDPAPRAVLVETLVALHPACAGRSRPSRPAP